MKVQNSWQLLFTAVMTILCMGFVSCSSDDEESGNDDEMSLEGGSGLQAPKYEAYSALYEINGNSASPIKSIELTASGNYIVYSNSNGYYNYANKRSSHVKFLPSVLDTRASSGNIIYGKYTVIDNNTFKLEDWGTITITGSSDNALSITVTPEGSASPYTVTAAKKNQLPDSSLTNKLCRTWAFSSIRIKVTIGGQVKWDKEYNISQYPREWFKDIEKIYPDEDYGDIEDELEEFSNPEQVVFTKAGTYMVKYTDNTLAISTWSWKDIDNGILSYSWNYASMDDHYAAGEVTISFRGDQLAVTETDYDEYYEDEDIITTTVYLNEVK